MHAKDTCRFNITPPNTEISEDCLTLNIYVPGNISYDSRKSVMVWIHGGGFYTNQGSMYNGTYIALYGDVIVVTVNYRLGVLGFLSTGNKDLPGNLGLWDQHLALQWIKDNIASFGGDPNSITLFGMSSGGASVSLHTLIPRNKHLFQRVIAQSGTANSYLAFVYDPLFYVKVLGKLLGCTSDTEATDTKQFVHCINGTSAEAILSAQEAMSWHRGDRARYELMFGAVVDGDVFTDYPEELLSRETSASFQLFRSVDFLAGGTDKEGSMFYGIFHEELSKEFNFNPMDGFPPGIVCEFLIPGLVKDLFPKCLHRRVLEQAICQKYRGTDDGSRASKMLDLYGDVFFIVPVIKILSAHSKDNSITNSYQYLFSRHYTSTLPDWFVGTPHTAEKTFLFRGTQRSNIAYNRIEDLTLAKQMIKLWTNFAKYGNPSDITLPKWSPYTEDDGYFYNISFVPASSSTHVFRDRVSFWMSEVPQIVKATCQHQEL